MTAQELAQKILDLISPTEYYLEENCKHLNEATKDTVRAVLLTALKDTIKNFCQEEVNKQ